MIRTFWSSRAIRVATAQSVLWCAYAVIPLTLSGETLATDSMIEASLGLALGLLMAVRINRAYERWWEARILWGNLVNASRNLAVKVHVYARPDADEAKRVHRLISGFAYGLCRHLRGGVRLSTLAHFESEEADPEHVPSWFATQLHTRFSAWSESGRVTQDQLRMFDLEARVFLDVAGACERIRNTLLPPALTWVTRVAIAVFLIATPWFLRDDFGWLVVPVAGLASFLVIVSETIAFTLERPFGTDLDQLDLASITKAIESSTAEILGVAR